MITKDTHSKPNEQLFPKQMVILESQLKTAVTSTFTFFIIKLQNRTKHEA